MPLRMTIPLPGPFRYTYTFRRTGYLTTAAVLLIVVLGIVLLVV
jgi:hypothetical protein